MDENARRLAENADTLLKYQSLLAQGAISQEEFERIKIELLGSGFNETADDVSSSADSEAPSPSDDKTASEESVDVTSAEVVQESQRENSNPVTLKFGWVGGKLLPHVYDGDKKIPYDSFIKPEGESQRDFCKRVAEMIENDLGRPVEYTLPAEEKTLKQNGCFGCFIIIILIGVVSILFQACTTSCSASGRSSYSTSTRKTTVSNSVTNNSDSSQKNITKQDTSTLATKSQAISGYINSSEFTNLRVALDNACDDLMGLLSSGNASEVQSRIASLSTALSSFKSVSAPDDCAMLRDAYIQASQDAINGLNILYEILTTAGDHTSQIDKATYYFELTTACVNNGTQELNRLEKKI